MFLMKYPRSTPWLYMPISMVPSENGVVSPGLSSGDTGSFLLHAEKNNSVIQRNAVVRMIMVCDDLVNLEAQIYKLFVNNQLARADRAKKPGAVTKRYGQNYDLSSRYLPLMKKPVIVIKFGSAAITTETGAVDEQIILEIARQTAKLQEQYNIVLVSSGAVAAGKAFIPRYKGTLPERKAAAAIGNPVLINMYASYFKPFKIALAQSLCERHHFANRDQFLQLKRTYETLWRNNIIPIANENDVVSNKELKFSDN